MSDCSTPPSISPPAAQPVTGVDHPIVPATERESPFTAATPVDVVRRASAAATELKRIVDDRRLSTIIRGKRFVRAEGWAVLGAMLGIVAREVEVVENESGDFVATVELIRLADGSVIGRGSAMCGADEEDWAKRPKFQRRSMAITRATGKAFRLTLAWVVRLAGYEPTPAEEVDRDEHPHALAASPAPPSTMQPQSAQSVVVDTRFATSTDEEAPASVVDEIKQAFTEYQMTVADAREVLNRHGVARLEQITIAQADAIVTELRERRLEVDNPF